ncbi:MAG: M61 family metallopeptidase [Anaerolineae bacterium]|nr:M61 family metallopeptidase [Gloeobacterales cyanobacterium ES-bin-313]
MAPTFRHRVGMGDPHAHYFTVELRVEGWSADILPLQMPVWTPGSYLVREYSRHLQDFTATSSSGIPLDWHKQAKQTWHVQTAGVSQVQIRYRIYANELTVRTSHLDASHGYFNGACLFLYVPEYIDQSQRVTILPPQSDWRVTTALPLVAESGNSFTYEARSFHELVDSPFEIGTHQIIPFTVLGKPHTLAVWGKSNLDYNRYLPDLENLIKTEANLFGGLPYENYVFIVHFADGYGGLEHHNSTTLLYSRFELQPDEKYYKFLGLTAHEFFHLWNVKRIRPSTLDRFDYAQENYTRNLWFCEGTTSYYDELFVFRAGITDVRTYLKQVSEAITRLQTTPGRRVQLLEESSFDTWIKLYRPSENTPNTQISYYLKGQLVSWLLDLHIRLESAGQRSLDDVMRLLWVEFASKGQSFPEEALTSLIEKAAGCPLEDFFALTLRSNAELPYERYLRAFGLQLTVEYENRPYLGIRTQEKEGRTTLSVVEEGSPAHKAGLSAGDELIALDGWKVAHSSLKERLSHLSAKTLVDITVFRREELMTLGVRLGEPVAERYHLSIRKDANEQALARLQSWLGKIEG